MNNLVQGLLKHLEQGAEAFKAEDQTENVFSQVFSSAQNTGAVQGFQRSQLGDTIF